ncbi:MAG: hypothetical protein UZ17_ACD001000017 [Acidobacteria bacterium OLB17]|nr:MAG: hypothetical protein UZ17_ACD001000017 [Acidobacteria bacterium OLB17]MCZ2391505.1 hypothetical protein [Acidobacteriota bacterium]
MLRRFAAIIFVLALAGQIYAGVCGCIGAENKNAHSCCKPKASVENSMQGKACCETACTMSNSQNIVPDRLETLAKVTFAAIEPASPVAAFDFSPTPAAYKHIAPQVTAISAADLRPPELYLRHHAFRI